MARFARMVAVHHDGRIEPFEVEMAPFTVILGDCQTADVQQMWDRIAGGAPAICTHRTEGRQ